MSGVKSEISELAMQDISNYILSRCKTLTLVEIYKAFENERFNVYEQKTGHFDLFDGNYFASIIEKYKKWKKDFQVLHNLKPIQQTNLLAQMTESQKQQIVNDGINRRFAYFLEHSEVETPCVHIFDQLLELELIKNNNNTVGYYQKKLQEATEILKKEYSTKKSEDVKEAKKIKIDLANIITGESEKIMPLAKKLVLLDFFEKKKTEGLTKII